MLAELEPQPQTQPLDMLIFVDETTLEESPHPKGKLCLSDGVHDDHVALFCSMLTLGPTDQSHGQKCGYQGEGVLVMECWHVYSM
jgi:hypothetical protein